MNNKTTAVRIIPVPGKNVGDMVEFGGLLGSAPIMAVNAFSSRDFIGEVVGYRRRFTRCEID
jgi:uncharacterized protein (UPF0210 family)